MFELSLAWSAFSIGKVTSKSGQPSTFLSSIHPPGVGCESLVVAPGRRSMADRLGRRLGPAAALVKRGQNCRATSTAADNIRMEDFETAALPYMDDLFRTASRLLRNRDEAADVIQDVYMEAWKSFHRYEPGTNCRAWLYKILFHRLHHHRRKWFKFERAKEDDGSLEDTLTYEPPVPEHLTDEAVLEAFEEVPQEFRMVVLLSDVQEFSYKEIASILSIPVGTVMSRLSRGRRILRERLADVAKSYGIGGGKDDRGVPSGKPQGRAW